jgi:hypothetical protein
VVETERSVETIYGFTVPSARVILDVTGTPSQRRNGIARAGYSGRESLRRKQRNMTHNNRNCGDTTDGRWSATAQ